MSSVPDLTHFVIVAGTNKTQTQDSLTVYPLVAPLLKRSGQS